MQPPPPRTIPPLLHPYTSLPPPTSLILLTSVLNASTNWLLLRFLCGALTSSDNKEGHSEGFAEGETKSNGERDGEGEGEVKVVFVSFMRDWEFWRREGARCGLDLLRLVAGGRLVYVDGLTALFSPLSAVRGPEKGGGVQGIGEGQGVKVLRSARGEDIERDIRAVIEGLKSGVGDGKGRRGRRKVVLVLDQPDVVLAATGTSTSTGGADDGGTGMGMGEVVASLRQHVHSTILTAAADFPLLQTPTTPLEINHAAFVVGLAHLARWTVSLRGLDTGTARDISGVLRVTRGAWDEEDYGEGEGEEGEERELLYFVGGDGGVKVFERGA